MEDTSYANLSVNANLTGQLRSRNQPLMASKSADGARLTNRKRTDHTTEKCVAIIGSA